MLGSTIEILMQERHWSQAELAKRTKLTPAAISLYVSEQREPTICNLIKLCEAFEVTPNDILGYHSSSRHEMKLEVTLMKEKLRQIAAIVQR